MLPLSAPTSNNVRCVTYLHFCRWPSHKPAASPVTVLVSYILTLNQFLPARTTVESHRIHDGYFWRRFYVFFLLFSKSWQSESNRQPHHYKWCALPIVLCQQNSPNRAWTCDTSVNSRMLCLLSYRRIYRWLRRDSNPALLPWKGNVANR